MLFAGKDTIPVEYADFVNVFSKELAKMLPEQTGINKHAIKLEENKQPLYGLIYSLGLVELETFKTYIKTNLANDFIRPLISPAGASILFVWKLNGSLCLCVNYRGLNYFTIKNRYLLPLIGKSLYWLGQAKRLTQLDFISAYH